jgi:hypothetical protein
MATKAFLNQILSDGKRAQTKGPKHQLQKCQIVNEAGISRKNITNNNSFNLHAEEIGIF